MELVILSYSLPLFSSSFLPLIFSFPVKSLVYSLFSFCFSSQVLSLSLSLSIFQVPGILQTTFKGLCSRNCFHVDAGLPNYGLIVMAAAVSGSACTSMAWAQFYAVMNRAWVRKNHARHRHAYATHKRIQTIYRPNAVTSSSGRQSVEMTYAGV
jgi:hypothetical protein